jgi:hypothetical protein
MLTFFKEKTSLLMGNSPTNGEYSEEDFYDKTRIKNGNGLIFFAGTDKARV